MHRTARRLAWPGALNGLLPPRKSPVSARNRLCPDARARLRGPSLLDADACHRRSAPPPGSVDGPQARDRPNRSTAFRAIPDPKGGIYEGNENRRSDYTNVFNSLREDTADSPSFWSSPISARTIPLQRQRGDCRSANSQVSVYGAGGGVWSTGPKLMQGLRTARNAFLPRVFVAAGPAAPIGIEGGGM